MSGFSNSLGYLIFTASMPSESDISIHTFSNFTKVSRFVSSIRSSVSEYSLPTIFEFCNNLWWTDCRKSLHNLSTHLPLRRYTPLQFAANANTWLQTRTRTRNPGLTFPKPENPGLQKEPGFGNSRQRASNDSGVIENMDFHGFRRYVFGSFENLAKAIMQ